MSKENPRFQRGQAVRVSFAGTNPGLVGEVGEVTDPMAYGLVWVWLPRRKCHVCFYEGDLEAVREESVPL